MTRNGDPSTKLFSGLERSKANRWRRTAHQPQHAPSTPPLPTRTTANPRADPSAAPISSRASRHEVAHLLLFRPDISPVGANRPSVMRCGRSLLVVTGRCCCCHGCCHPRCVRA